jgi:hypothetical protein
MKRWTPADYMIDAEGQPDDGLHEYVRADDLPRWIAVGERLPEDGLEMVLLTDGEWVTFGRQSGDGWYVEESAEALGPRELSRFSHWMPLPEPPEVK